jgi:AcrR family transcriptional regulator
MDADVNPRESSRRDEQARASRGAMLDAARELFVGQRYAGTTLAMVAAEAGVSVQYVYKVFGNKAGLVKALFDVAIAPGARPHVPVPWPARLTELDAIADR